MDLPQISGRNQQHLVDPNHEVGTATERPERVIGMHFFNPTPVLPLVEIIPCQLTSADNLSCTKEFA